MADHDTMRLRDIQHVLRAQLPRLQFRHEQIPGTTNQRVLAFREMLDAIRTIRNTGMFTKEIDAILENDVLVRHVEDGIIVTGDTISNVTGPLRQLQSRGRVLLETLDANLDEEPEAAIAVRLPAVADLDTVADALKEIQAALQQLILNDYIKGDIRLIAFDRGSNWLELFLGSLMAVRVVGMIVRMIMDVRLKDVDVATRWENLRTMKIGNDALKSIQEALASELDEFKRERSEAIAQVAGIPASDNEMRARIKFATAAISDLVSRGAAFLPSGATSEEVRDEFPQLATLNSVMANLPGSKKELEGEH